ncbi:unnamed protein product [Dovyalis caffra]|uniref:60S ribosomal protein L35 n=1 Tax=Dovyalis caffra TaxID=77055 RepID=A0AAV1REJ9_9ROSI|nr:unnamed protein product [Dovyalis caffra]
MRTNTGLEKEQAEAIKRLLKDLKAELALLRVAKVTDRALDKLSKIKVRKVLLREAHKNKKLLPLDPHPKKTRAIRKRLTKHRLSLKTDHEKKREMYFPMRKYTIKV